jgi:hypothetical protein
MSKIEALFSAGGRGLFESERPAVEAFKEKYARALASAAGSQQRGERSKPAAGVVVTTVRRLAATQLAYEKEVRASKSVSAQARTIKRQKNLANLVSKKLSAPKNR